MKTLTIVKFGGRLLYTINQKGSANIYTTNIKSNKENHLFNTVVAFSNKKDAFMFAHSLENHIKENKVMPDFIMNDLDNSIFNIHNLDIKNDVDEINDIDTLELSNLFISKSDYYELQNIINTHNMNLLICEKDYSNYMQYNGKIYSASENPNDYVDLFNSIYL